MFCCIIPRDDRFVFRCLVGLQVLLICWTYSWLGAADWTGWWLVLIDGMFGSLQSHLLVFCMVLYELSVQYMFVKWWYRSISWQWSGVHISFLLAMWVCWMFIKVTIFTIWWWPFSIFGDGHRSSWLVFWSSLLLTLHWTLCYTLVLAFHLKRYWKQIEVWSER